MSYPARRGSRSPRSTGRWDPFAEIEALHDRLDQLFFGSRSSGSDWSGDVDLEETEDGWVVEAQLPGVPPEGLDVELADRELSIKGSAEASSESGRARRQFNYRLTLPAEADADRAEANLEHGVLRVKVPRSPRASVKKIQVGTPTSSAAGAADAGRYPEASPTGEAQPSQAPPAETPPAPYAPSGTGAPEGGTPVDTGVPPSYPGQPSPYPSEPASASYPVPGQQPYPPPEQPREPSDQPGQQPGYQSWQPGSDREPHDQPT